jgi:hypothetical protein
MPHTPDITSPWLDNKTDPRFQPKQPDAPALDHHIIEMNRHAREHIARPKNRYYGWVLTQTGLFWKPICPHDGWRP